MKNHILTLESLWVILFSIFITQNTNLSSHAHISYHQKAYFMASIQNFLSFHSWNGWVQTNIQNDARVIVQFQSRQFTLFSFIPGYRWPFVFFSVEHQLISAYMPNASRKCSTIWSVKSHIHWPEMSLKWIAGLRKWPSAMSTIRTQTFQGYRECFTICNRELKSSQSSMSSSRQ